MGAVHIFTRAIVRAPFMAAMAACALLAGARATALAEMPSGQTPPRFALSSGIDVTAGSFFGYAGGVWGFGRNLDAPGFRIRVLTGKGMYDYDTSLPAFGGSVTVDGDVFLARLLAGYQWQRGEWTLKAYGGIAYEEHELSPGDPGNRVSGSEVGAAGEIGLWRNLGKRSWMSLDAGYADTFGSYRAQLRVGRKTGARVSLGLEGGVLGNEEYDGGRGGAFLRYRLRRLEVTLSGGVSTDRYTDETGGYGALGLYRKF